MGAELPSPPEKVDKGIETDPRSDWEAEHYHWNRWLDRFNSFFRFCSNPYRVRGGIRLGGHSSVPHRFT